MKRIALDSKQVSVISCDMTLFIRLLEVAREELKDDAALHYLVERCSEQAALKGAPLTMDDYQVIMGQTISSNDETKSKSIS